MRRAKMRCVTYVLAKKSTCESEKETENENETRTMSTHTNTHTHSHSSLVTQKGLRHLPKCGSCVSLCVCV